MHDFDSHEEHDAGAAQTLADIASGGLHLLMITRKRIADVLDDLDRGAFEQAENDLGAAMQTITPLARAQGYIAIANQAVLVKCSDLRAGMTIVDLGEVESVTTQECANVRCSGHVQVRIGEHELNFGGNREVYVMTETGEE